MRAQKKKAACAAFLALCNLLFRAGVLHPAFQFLSRTESDHAARRNRNVLTGFRVASRTLVLVSQIKIAKTRQLDLFSILQSSTDLFKEQFYQVFGIPFAKP
ncbi:Uncharacterised protein [Serratia fonticola]|uniref:Secreted protein n=1 Tax=Serratia fonticola TaxID=47917 RepID=A0A4U9T8A9_SERFO|nr:Uncharacterised protein [Serratia fonticola]